MTSLFRVVLTALTMITIFTGLAFAQNVGMPVDKQTGFQTPVTGVMEFIVDFEGALNYLIIFITLFVFALLAYVMVKFRASKNQEPSKRTHNTLLEVAWTAIPVLILMVMAIPSFQLLWDQKITPDGEREYAYAGKLPAPEVTIKAIGIQWAWEFEYPDEEELAFSSYMKADDELEEGEPRLLSVDNQVVVPVNTTVRLLVTSSDVLHAFAMPAFGVKVDAVPGRINETWFNVKKEGIYYGQCSEICGKDHAFMPIAVRVVSKDIYNQWLNVAKVDIDEAGTLLKQLVAENQIKTERLARR